MKPAVAGARIIFASMARRVGRVVRRHPLLTAAFLPALFAFYVACLLPFTPGIGDLRKAKDEHPTVVFSADGRELAVFRRANRDWVKLTDVSPHVVAALLATEDQRFYAHGGLDWKRTAVAVVRTLTGDRQGGSTITQQLARNLYPDEIGRAPTITRKIKEAITAVKIERVYSKDEILETYLNTVSFLYNAWGIEMAARTYFDKPASRLDELEAATLVGMLKGTSYYNPVLNPERALRRRNVVLAQMVKQDKLAAARYETLHKEPLRLDFERQPEVAGAAPHLAEYLRRWLIEWADRHDYNIYTDGLVVRTTVDARLQAIANESVRRQGDALQAVADVEWSRPALPPVSASTGPYVTQRSRVDPFAHYWAAEPDRIATFIRESAEYRLARERGLDEALALQQLQADAQFLQVLRRQKTRLQAGFLAIEPSTGYVKAWVGSRDFAEDKFDHVQQARRQPGSTFKPFVYGAAFESGIAPSETFVDQSVEIRMDDRSVWNPKDVGGPPSGQPMTLRDGLAQSKNTITAQLMMRVGPQRVASLARSMGVRDSRLEEVPSLALGTSPVTLKEMVSSFATIANGGSYIEPIIVTRIESRDGVVLDSFTASASESAMSPVGAQTLLDVMRGVIDKGTAAGLRGRFGLQGDLAGKTGTTQDNADGWFILMHPQLVAGAWVGFNDNRVAMRSEYWGQGAHNALLLVGEFYQQSFRAHLLDAKARFPAGTGRDLPWTNRMNDWFGSVFQGAPATQPAPEPEPAVVVIPASSETGMASGAVGTVPAPAEPVLTVPAPPLPSERNATSVPPAIAAGTEPSPGPAATRAAGAGPGPDVITIPATGSAGSAGATAPSRPAARGETVLVPRRLRPREGGSGTPAIRIVPPADPPAETTPAEGGVRRPAEPAPAPIEAPAAATGRPDLLEPSAEAPRDLRGADLPAGPAGPAAEPVEAGGSATVPAE